MNEMDETEEKDEYKYTYNRLFNIVFHVGVIFNIILVTWLYLVYFEII